MGHPRSQAKEFGFYLIWNMYNNFSGWSKIIKAVFQKCFPVSDPLTSLDFNKAPSFKS